MKADARKCDPVRVSLYQDGELTPEARKDFEAHLAECPACLQRLAANRIMSYRLKRQFAEAAPRLDAAFSHDVVEALRRRQAPWHERLREWFSFKKALYPVAGFALLAIISLGVIRYQNSLKPEPGPSAIVDSFSGNVASVMILEVPETRQTIIWYTESEEPEDDIGAMEI